MKICILLLPFYFLLCTLSAHAQEFTYEIKGEIIEQPTYRLLREDTLLNPEGRIIKFSEWRNRFYSNIRFNLHYKDIGFISKFRPTISAEEGKSDIKNIVDDAYFDIKLGGRFFLYGGKKNIRDGVGFGSNPTDFLGEGKEVDFTKREEERRAEREGNYLFGVDTFYKNVTLIAIFAPRINNLQDESNRVLLKANLLIDSINTDMSLHYFYGDIPGVGFNISTTMSDELVLYTETAFRWGSNRKSVKLISEGAPNIYEINGPDVSERVYPHVVIGGHYTFKNGTNIICEYIYNGDGYNGKEWDDIKNFVKYNNAEYKRGYLKDVALSNLLVSNKIISFREVRRNYIFARLNNPEILAKTDGAIVLILNADDKSFLINPSVDYKLKANTTIGLSALIFAGKNDTEFGMVPWKSEISMVFKFYF